MDKSAIESELQKKYKELFVISNHVSGFWSNKVRFKATPKKDMSVVFSGHFNKKTRVLNDFYLTTYYSSEASKWLSKTLKDIAPSYISAANIRCNQTEGKVVSLDEFFFNNSPEIDIVSKVFIPEKIDSSNYKNLLEPIVNLCIELQAKKLNTIVFDLSFFEADIAQNSGSYEGKSVQIKPKDLENNAKIMDKRANRILFKLNNGAKAPTAKAIFEAQSENIKSPRSVALD